MDSSTSSPPSVAATTPASNLLSPDATPSSSPPEPEEQPHKQPHKQQDQTKVQDNDNAFDWQFEEVDNTKRALEEAEREERRVGGPHLACLIEKMRRRWALEQQGRDWVE
ncbi:hypothetical protein F4808DRAFT_459878 [Astrocystis sublimbata]|nr:hypothetical protein F4808DRAFT_459878 [Astrocystis sublimbata]